MPDRREPLRRRRRRLQRSHLSPNRWARRLDLDVRSWTAPGEPVPLGDALSHRFEPHAEGESWGGRPWGTTWFAITGTIPGGWAGSHVEVAIDLGFSGMPGFQCEGLVYRRRTAGTSAECWELWRGLHPLNHRLVITREAVGGEVIDLLVEAAANPVLVFNDPTLDGDVETASPDPIYRLGRVELLDVDREWWHVGHDLDVVWGLSDELSDDDPRRWQLDRAATEAADLIEGGAMAADVAAALRASLDSPARATAHRILTIGHAHIDTAWLWPLRETRRKCARTFANAVDLMAEYPEFQFVASQAAQYDWVAQDHPELFDAIARRIAEGRWHPTGGMWVEADTNLPGGESLARQFLYGQRFFDHHFGRTCDETWLPDVFGYPASLPQIMRLGGTKAFLTQKLSWNDTNRMPHHTFEWEGIDGTRILSHFPPIDTYNATLSPVELAHAVREFNDHDTASSSIAPFGFGDGGGGPSRDMLERFRRQADLDGSPRLEMAPPSEFFERTEVELGPHRHVWMGELYFEKHRGTYTSQAATKAGNRRCEHLLRAAEWVIARVWGTVPDADSPWDRLDDLWREVLTLQFHDILPGSSIAWVHREAAERFAAIADELRSIIDDALMLGSNGRSVLFNPADAAVAGVAVVDDPRGDVAKRLAGVAPAVPTQRLSDGRTAVGAELPAWSQTLFGDAAPSSINDVGLAAVDGGFVLDNGLLRVVVDRRGLISSLCDLVGDREMVPPGMAMGRLDLHPDEPVEYDAWDIDATYRNTCVSLEAADRVVAGEPGPLLASVVTEWEVGGSRIEMRYELRAGAPQLDVRFDIDFQEQETLLKFAVPAGLYTDSVQREIQYGHVRSPIHSNTSWDAARFEVCAHRWIRIVEGDSTRGLSVLNDSKYGHDVRPCRAADGSPATEMRVTLLRGARYPDPQQDQGRHQFTLAIRTDAGLGDVIGAAERLNHPVVGLVGDDGDDRTADAVPRIGDVAPRGGSIRCAAVKSAADRSGDLIVRLYEAEGRRSSAEVCAPWGGGAQPCDVAAVDLLEHPLEPSFPQPGLRWVGGCLNVTLGPFQIATLRFSNR